MAPSGLAYDLARVSGGAALALALVFTVQRRFQARAAASALQAWAVAAAAACQGWAQGLGALVLAAAAVLVVNGVLLPAALARAAERLERVEAGRERPARSSSLSWRASSPVRVHTQTGSALGPPGPEARSLSSPAVLVLSALIVAAVVLAVQPAAPDAGPNAGGDLAAAISAVLLGLAGMTTARGALQQASGLLAMENGLVLLVTGLPHLPSAATLTVAVLALGASVVLTLSVLGVDDLA